MSTTDTVYWHSLNSRRGAETVYYKAKPTRFNSHPWLTTVGRSTQEIIDNDGNTATDSVWSVVIKPGFVNGEEPIYRQKYVEKTVVDGVKVNKTAERNVSLLDGPEIALENKESNFAPPPRPLPFFKEMGITDANASSGVSVSEFGVKINVTPSNEEQPTRYLLQTVIYLAQARATQRLISEVVGNIVTGQLVNYKVTYDLQALQGLGDRPRIQIGGMMPELAPPIMGRIYEDAGLDYLEICTVYFVSPDGFSPSTAKDATPQERGVIPTKDWDPYVKHNLFWNLNYAMRTEPPVNLPGYMLDPFTAAFTGRYTVAAGAITGSINALLDEALAAAFNNASNRGRYWSA